MKLPQECPKCKVSLADQNPAIPPGKELMFSLVLMDKDEFQCPVCRYVWPRPANKQYGPRLSRKGRKLKGSRR